MVMQNPLDILFKEVKRGIYEAKVRAERQVQEPVPKGTTLYSNPENWRPGRAVLLIESREHIILGVFREYFHKRSATARRLLPAPDGTEHDLVELVYGEWWLSPRHQGPLVVEDSPDEIVAVKRRFHELLELCLKDVENEQRSKAG